MMRTLLQWALILAVPAVWVSAARPAERAIPEGTTIKLLLLRQPSVQEELKLSPAEVEKIKKFTNKQGDALEKVMKLSKDERRAKLKEMGQENKKFLADNLKPEQAKRLEQITMQQTALFQLRRPEIIKALKLTKEQQQKIRKLRREARRNIGKLLDEEDREGLREKFAKLRKETRKKIRALLTAEQKEKVKKLLGEPFKGKIVFERLESRSKDK
jgi:hypothetical protein